MDEITQMSKHIANQWLAQKMGESRFRLAKRNKLSDSDGPHDMSAFLEEEGQQMVTSPLTGKQIKLVSLKGMDDPKAKDMLSKRYKQWKEKRTKKDEPAKPEEKQPEGQGTPTSDKGTPLDVPSKKLAPPTGILDLAENPPAGAKPTVVNTVVQDAKKGNPPTKENLDKATELVDQALKSDISVKEKSDIEKLDDWLGAMAGEPRKEKKNPRQIKLDISTIPDKVLEIGESNHLNEDTVGALAEHVRKPEKKKKSIAEKRKEFADSVEDPEEKKRILDMSEDDFEEMVNAIMSKRGSLRAQVIRLAYARPHLRPLLLVALDEVC